VLAEGDAGLPVAEICRRHGISSGLFYQWKNKYSGVSVSELMMLEYLLMRAICAGARTALRLVAGTKRKSESLLPSTAVTERRSAGWEPPKALTRVWLKT
jgi:putative transposase